jgi:hypothetical protein
MLKCNTTKSLNNAFFELEKFYLSNNNHHPSYLERWVIYTEIINQIVHLKKDQCVYKIYYLLMEGENINTTLIDIINSDDDLFLVLYPYIHQLNEYIANDVVELYF